MKPKPWSTCAAVFRRHGHDVTDGHGAAKGLATETPSTRRLNVGAPDPDGGRHRPRTRPVGETRRAVMMRPRGSERVSSSRLFSSHCRGFAARRSPSVTALLTPRVSAVDPGDSAFFVPP
jgi:hypothetical protein